jgi:hypothetical protein
VDLYYPYNTSGGQNSVYSEGSEGDEDVANRARYDSSKTFYCDNADGFYRKHGLENFVSQDKRSRKKLDEWFENKFGLDPLLREVHREMDDLGSHFRSSTREITPENSISKRT